MSRKTIDASVLLHFVAADQPHAVLFQQGPLFHNLILADEFFAVLSFESSDNKVTAGHILKMIDKDRIDQGASGGTDKRDRLGGHFFRYNHPEA